jgi:phage shock protein PspC (stress-responsive transcriptional regulator)
MKKILALFNVKKWLETFVTKFLASKAAKHAASTLAGVIAGLVAKYKLDQYGVQVDVPALTESLIVGFGALAGAIMNWAQKVMDKDGDGLPG